MDMVNERLPEEFIDYAYVRRGAISGPSTPQPRQQVLYDEPGTYEQQRYAGAHGYAPPASEGDGSVRRGSVGTTYSSTPSTRRRTWEDKEDLLRKFANMHVNNS